MLHIQNINKILLRASVCTYVEKVYVCIYIYIHGQAGLRFASSARLSSETLGTEQ